MTTMHFPKYATAAALLAAAALSVTACGAEVIHPAPHHPAAASPANTPSALASAEAAAAACATSGGTWDGSACTPPSPAPSGPDQLIAGGTETLVSTTSGNTIGTITVSVPVLTTRPADTYGEQPANGYYVIVKVTAAADPGNHDGWFVSPLDLHAVVHGQHYDEGNGNAYSALTSAQSGTDLSATLAAGETVTGYLAFDVPSPHGSIVYAPNSDGQPVAEWSY